MREPAWVRPDVVRAIHLRQIAEHGGEAIIRDAGLLDSALARPRNLWAYADPKPDLAAVAAAYAFGIVRNHPFLDGNKRTGLVVMRTFLAINGDELDASQHAKHAALVALASSALDEPGLVDWVRLRIRRTPGRPSARRKRSR
ncbi:MAG: type II toxin-antitoxin system death-on-curing family toxin [Planctomycetes bacterium]|nr:type II toxin-antitoxin system death-on-curing family toxin [Planctomycetota bacterium]